VLSDADVMTVFTDVPRTLLVVRTDFNRLEETQTVDGVHSVVTQSALAGHGIARH